MIRDLIHRLDPRWRLVEFEDGEATDDPGYSNDRGGPGEALAPRCGRGPNRPKRVASEKTPPTCHT